MKALLLAAGLGTRLKPFTENHPKALALVNGKTLLERNIRYLQQFGIRDVVINVHHFAEQIIAALEQAGGYGSRYEISDERDAVLETGGGLKKAAPFFRDEETFLVMNVDILSNFDLRKMLEQHYATKALATLAVQKRASSRHFLLDDAHRLFGWENTATGEQKIPGGQKASALQPFAFSGIQVLQHALLSKIKREGKFSLVDVYLDVCADEPVIGWEHSGDLLLDVGHPDRLKQAERLFGA